MGKQTAISERRVSRSLPRASEESSAQVRCCRLPADNSMAVVASMSTNPTRLVDQAAKPAPKKCPTTKIAQLSSGHGNIMVYSLRLCSARSFAADCASELSLVERGARRWFTMSEKEIEDTEAFLRKQDESRDTADFLRERGNQETVPVAANERVGAPVPRDLRAGQFLAGKYRIERILGQGGMGVVMAVEHIELRERMALKLMLPGSLENADAVMRFLREARAAVKIKGDHVARVLDVGRLETGEPYIVLEYLEGIDLAQLLDKSGPLPISDAIDYVLQACEALAEAHALGIIHRDLKPANIFLTRRPDGAELIKVLDFGISKIMPKEDSHEHADFGMTQTKQALGTPLYMPPEQMASARAAEMTSDIWSLGVILFELMTGMVPFQANSLVEVRQRIRSDPPPEIRRYRKDAPRGLEPIIQRCLEKDPANRYPNVAELAMALEEFGSAHSHVSVERIQRMIVNAKLSMPPPGGLQASVPGRATGGARARARSKRFLTMGTMSVGGVAVLGLGLLVWKLVSSSSAPAPMLSASAVPSAAASAGAISLSGPAPIVVMPFENLTGDSAWNGLSLGASDALKQGLWAVTDVRVAEGDAAKSVGAGLRVKGSVKKIGSGLQLVAQVESVDVSGGTSRGEPVEVDAPSGEPERAFEALRRGVIDEVRLMARLWDRHRRAVVGTQSDIARAKLLQFYAMVGPAAQRKHVDAGMDLLDAAITADPKYVPAIVERAYLRTLGGKDPFEARVTMARKELDTAAQMAPEDPTVAVMRCRVTQVATKAADRPTDALITLARQACRNALQVAPSSAYVQVALARIHDLTCEDDKAARLLEQSLELDRALWGRSLVQLVMLTLQHGQVDVADRMSAKLVAFQGEEERQGEHAFSRRAGMPPVTDAHFLRGIVLLRRESLEEARGEFERVLAMNMAGPAAKYDEAAAIRGIVRASEGQGKHTSPERERRLADLEAGFRASAKDSPEEIVFVAQAYADVDAQAAVAWFDRAAAPSSCSDVFQRALVYRTAERRDVAKKMLNFCQPVEQWEKSCLTSVRRLVSE